MSKICEGWLFPRADSRSAICRDSSFLALKDWTTTVNYYVVFIIQIPKVHMQIRIMQTTEQTMITIRNVLGSEIRLDGDHSYFGGDSLV